MRTGKISLTSKRKGIYPSKAAHGTPVIHKGIITAQRLPRLFPLRHVHHLYRLPEHASPALRRAVLSAVYTPCLLVCLDLRYLGHLCRRSTAVACVLAVVQGPRAYAAQARRMIIAEWVVVRAPPIEVLIIAVARTAASALFVRLRRVIRAGVRIRAARRLVQTKLLLLVVRLVANSR